MVTYKRWKEVPENLFSIDPNATPAKRLKNRIPLPGEEPKAYFKEKPLYLIEQLSYLFSEVEWARRGYLVISEWRALRKLASPTKSINGAKRNSL